MGILRSLGDRIETIKVFECMRALGLVLLEEMSLESLELRRHKEQFVSLQLLLKLVSVKKSGLQQLDGLGSATLPDHQFKR